MSADDFRSGASEQPDLELVAIRRICEALAPFGLRARGRVLRFVLDQEHERRELADADEAKARGAVSP